MSKDVNDLVPEMRDKVCDAVMKMNKDAQLKWLGVQCVAITETKRELAVQMAYYSRGRMAIGDVQKMYAAAGLYPKRKRSQRIQHMDA